MPRLTFITYDGQTRCHELQPGLTQIGRTPDNHLQIDELAVSSRHCELHYDGRTLIVRDLDSTNGTCVDGQPVKESIVQVGQVLSLGSVLIKVEASAPQPAGVRIDLKPVQLADGSYSCLRHRTERALFECPACFDLACGQCVRATLKPDGATDAACIQCGSSTQPIDWSGLTMTKKEAFKEWFIPDQVKKAIDFWNKYRPR